MNASTCEVVWNSSLKTLVVSNLPAGGYTLTPKISGELSCFYTSADSSVALTSTSVLYFSPVFTVKAFGEVRVYVKAASDSSPLFNAVQLKVNPNSLEDTNKFYTDSLGYCSLPYMPLGNIDIRVEPLEGLKGSYVLLDTAITITGPINGPYTFYLTGL